MLPIDIQVQRTPMVSSTSKKKIEFDIRSISNQPNINGEEAWDLKTKLVTFLHQIISFDVTLNVFSKLINYKYQR